MSATTKIKSTAKIFFKPRSRRYIFARKTAEILHIVGPLSLDDKYMEWVERAEPFCWSPHKDLDFTPKISIVVPVYNPPQKYFLPMVYSVINQTYQNWELVLVNASTKREVRKNTEDCENIDIRIKIVSLKHNKGIAGNTNLGIEAATGDFIALLDHDDLLAPQALYEVVYAIQETQDVGLIYSDEDKITADSKQRFDPHLKPDWSPHLLRELNYLNHLTVMKKSLIEKIGKYRQGFDGAQDYDLYLRIADQNPKTVHIPRILYHWRTTETSTANDFSAKKNVLQAGTKALEEHLERNNQTGRVRPIKKQPGFYKINYGSDKEKAVAVIIMPSAAKNQYKMLVETITRKIFKASLKVDIIIEKLVEDNNVEIPNNAVVKSIQAPNREVFIRKAMSDTAAETVMVINSAVIPKTKTWLEDIVGFVQQNGDVGLVAPILTSTDNEESIVDAGYVVRDGVLSPLFIGNPRGAHTYIGNADWVRSVDSISLRCFAARKAVLNDFLQNNSFNQKAVNTYFKKNNLKIISWPFVNMTYRGELEPSFVNTQYSSPSFVLTKQEFSVSKMINMPEYEEDE